MTRENNEERKTKSLVYIINYKVTVYKLENFIDTFDFIASNTSKVSGVNGVSLRSRPPHCHPAANLLVPVLVLMMMVVVK